MTDAPLSRLYNLGRLGQTGDEVSLDTSEEERVALAKTAGLLAVPSFSARIGLKKISPTNFAVAYRLEAKIVQACVVTLEPVAASIARQFTRELHYTPNLRRVEKEVIVTPGDDEVPEEIGSLHFDLAGPLMEEFLLAIDPYPRAPGVEFRPPGGEGSAPAESPFAVLKGLKGTP